jgi:hypothetical protein
MTVGHTRTVLARYTAAIGLTCWVIGVLAGLTDHTWKLGTVGWIMSGTLLTLIAIFVLIDGATAFHKARANRDS